MATKALQRLRRHAGTGIIISIVAVAGLSACSSINKAEDAATSGALQNSAFVATVEAVNRELTVAVAMRSAMDGGSGAATNRDWAEMFSGGGMPLGVKVEFLVAASFVTVWENDALVERNADPDSVVSMVQFSRGATGLDSATACLVSGATLADTVITAGPCTF
jgi:hypothetical protein